MRYLFFFLIIPFLIIPNVYAEVIEEGPNYIKELLPNGLTQNRILSYDRILDNGNYNDYIFTDDINYLQVESMGASVRLDKTTCEFSFFNKGIIGNNNALFNDDIIPYQSVFNSNIWTLINVLDIAPCVTSWDGKELKATKAGVVGYIEYVYLLIGNSWKTELRVFNDSGLNDRQFGFRQVIDLNRDSVKFGGVVRDLDSFDKMVFDRTWLENNKGRVMDLLNGYNFDFDLGFENLNRIWINDTGINSSQLTFEYFYNQDILLDGASLIIDPTLTVSNGNIYTIPSAAGGIGDGVDCGTTGSGGSSVAQWQILSDAGGFCYVGSNDFDISSIDNDALIYSVTIEADIGQLGGFDDLCDIVPITVDLDTATDDQIWDDIRAASPYVDSDSNCNSPQTNIQYDLGAQAVTDLTAELTADDEFRLGLREDNFEGMGNGQYSQWTNVELIVEYAVGSVWSPGPPINPSATTLRAHSIIFSWTPDNATGVIGYTIYNASTNSLNDSDWIKIGQASNVSSFNISGLSFCEEMYLKTSAFSINNGSNTTGVYGKAGCGPPNAVETLTSPSQSFTSIILNWIQPNLKGGVLTGSQINYTTPQGNNPNLIIVNNTGSSGVTYEISSLASGTDFSFRVSPWTEGGNNATGYILNASTLGNAGSFSVNTTNPDIVPIRYQRTDVNSTLTNVNVIYSNAFDPFECVLDFGATRTSSTYSNLDSQIYDTDFNYSTFQIVNSTNDVITFNCYDVATNETGKYVLTLSSGSIPLIAQVQAFQGGEYGTAGDFGALDLATLLIVIVSMVGLNRVNQTAGVIISFMIMFGLAAFELIEIPTLIFGSIAVIIMLVVSSTRKP